MIRYFGGKFNPITRGHLSILQKVVDSLNVGDIIVIGICCKSDDYPARKILVDAALNEAFGDKGPTEEPGADGKIAVVRQSDSSLWNFLEKGFSCETNAGKVLDSTRHTIKIVLGEDEYEALRKSFNADGNIDGAPWRYAREINAKYEIEHYPRVDGVSSTAVREFFHKDPCVSYAAVEKYVTRAVWHAIEVCELYEQAGFEDECAREERIAVAKYDPKKYEQPSATADIIATRNCVTDDPDVRRAGGEILLIRRKNFPYKGFWALPGGFLDVKSDMTIEETARREFKEETSVDYQFMPWDQFRTYSDMGSDPRCRIVDTVFAVQIGWFESRVDYVKPKAADDAAQLEWFPLSSLPRLAFNHRKIIEDWIMAEYNRRKNIQAVYGSAKKA